LHDRSLLIFRNPVRPAIYTLSLHDALPICSKPRFPAGKESVAREAIRSAISQEKDITTGSVLGIAGGANGGDILFLEACDEFGRSEEHTSELQSLRHLVCRLLLEKRKELGV